MVWVDAGIDHWDIYGCNLQKIRMIRKADTLFDQGKEEFEKNNYETALEHFQKAKEIYSDLKSEKAIECDEWILKIQEKKGICSGTGYLATFILVWFLRLQKKMNRNQTD